MFNSILFKVHCLMTRFNEILNTQLWDEDDLTKCNEKEQEGGF